MNGHIIPNSNIAVDFWRIKGKSTKYIHFLTHTHGDHIAGLTSTWHQPIFCSEITAFLLMERHGVSKSLLNILPVNDSVIVEVSESESFTVTTYDANHCPGAVMFYFEGNFGNVLYTGDFRLNEDILKICQNLSEKVDLLYLDNTFCSPKCLFPSQTECLNQIIDIIRQHPNHKVIIGVRKLGKETLLGQLGVILNETICVSQDCYKLCNFLFSTDVFTTNALSKNIVRLSTVPMSAVGSHLTSLNKLSPTIGIIPTALFTGCSSDFKDPNIFVVPYSDHSNYTELHRFVAALKPSQVMPIVTCTKGPFGIDLSDRLNMSCFDSYLTSPRHSPVKANYTAHDRRDKSCEYTSLGSTKRKSPPVLWANEGLKKKAKGVVYAEEDTEINEPAPDSESMVIDLCSDSECSEDEEVGTICTGSDSGDCVVVGNDKEIAVNSNRWPSGRNTHQLRGNDHSAVERGSNMETNLPNKTTESDLLNYIEFKKDNSSNILELDDSHLRSLISSAVCSALLPLTKHYDRTRHTGGTKTSAPDPNARTDGCTDLLQCSEGNVFHSASDNVCCLDRKRKWYPCSGKSNVQDTVSTADPKRLAHSTPQETEMTEAGKVWSKSTSKQTSGKEPRSSSSPEDLSSIEDVLASKTIPSGLGERHSEPDYSIEFCLDCFRKMFNLTSAVNKDKKCLVCEKSFIGSKVIVDKLFVKMLKDKFSL